MVNPIRKFKPKSGLNHRMMGIWVGMFAIIGVSTLLLTRAATPGIAVVVDSTLPNPTNVKTYIDDRTATVSWDPVANPASKNIVGYYVTWGTGGTYTSAKQTEYNAAQIQPLVNGTLYNVKVQAVQGSEVRVPTPGAHDPRDYGSDPNADEYRANGKVSSGVTATVTPSSARVDQARTQMTGFFDDFNTAAGAFDELKWNTAGSSCVYPGQLGAFVNNQFHAHSQVRSADDNPYTYCDRGQSVNRPRATFDITGKTEADPGVIIADFDGVTHGRDDWYIDLVPLTARKSGVPLDINSHDSIFQDDTNDPSLLRIVQSAGALGITTYNASKAPQGVNYTFQACTDFASNPTMNLDWCGGNLGTQVSSLNTIPMMPINNTLKPFMPNVRRHYRFEISSTKIKIFLDGYRIVEATMPAYFTNVKQWTVQNNTFSYNTGKDDPTNPTTTFLHWDNIGFNGPAPTTVVHNYIDGGPTGGTPYFGRGTTATEVPAGNRTSKINIPDPVGTPVKARLMFTFGGFGYQTYTWNAADNVVINGKKFSYPNPQTSSVQPPSLGDNTADGYRPFADSIALSAADLKQGLNDVQLNLVNTNGAAIYNVHIELEYTNGSEPAYTSPTKVFGASTFLSVIQPQMASHDSYLFVEQDFGLPSGELSGTNPPTDTTPPTVSITAPTANATLSGTSTLTANASDNAGISQVQFFIDNNPLTADNSSPYTFSLNTTLYANGTHSLKAVATDTSGNTTTSSTVSITITNTVADTTAPSVTITAPLANATISGTYTLSANASDAVGVTKVEFYIGTLLLNTDTTSPYSFAYDTHGASDGTHTVKVIAYDAAGNKGTATVDVTTQNVVTVRLCDFNADGTVGIQDLVVVLNNYSKSVATGTNGDCNSDGKVSIQDLVSLLGQYGSQK